MIKKIIKKFIKPLIPYKAIARYRVVCNRFNDIPNVTLHRYGNQNPSKIFYIIGFDRAEQGLFWIVLCNLSYIAYATSRHYIPVIDMQHFGNQYSNDKSPDKENAWEYFFEQPCGYSLASIRNSRNILLTNEDISPMNYKYFTGLHILQNKAALQKVKQWYKKYIQFSDTANSYIQQEYKRIFPSNKKILGVLCRGTDYTLKRPAFHPIQPEAAIVIEKAKQIMSEKNCEYLYLATEDEEIFSAFKNVFKDALLSNGQKRFHANDLQHVNYLSEIPNETTEEKYKLGLDYLSSIYLLSKCDCFVGGQTAGTVGAYLMNDHFEYDYVFDLGNYPSENEK